MQLVPQAVLPVGQLSWQVPFAHTWAVQAVLQAPQWAPFVRVSTQVAPQRVNPAWHAHCAFAQSSPGAHECPQTPQLAGSVLRFTQLEPHTD